MTSDIRTQEFETHRGLLFGVAYRMLGSAVDAEDMVQEAFLRFQNAQNVRTPRHYLVTTVTHLCLDQLKSAREKREQYVGTWLPEPIETSLSPQESVLMSESISLAFLVLLESLSPLERAVYLLREVFSYEYSEIAEMMGRSEAACRQVFHRAQTHIVEHRPRFPVTPEQHERIVQRFLTAINLGDIDSLNKLLAEDVTLAGDGGGKAAVVPHPLLGRVAVARMMMGLRRQVDEHFRFEIRHINGSSALLVFMDDQINSVFAFDVQGDHVSRIHVIRNPDKLQGIK